MCPYDNKHSGTSNTIREEVLSLLEPWELEELNNDSSHNIIIENQKGQNNKKPF